MRSVEPAAERVDEVERIAAAVYGLIVAASVMTAGADHLSAPSIGAAVVVTVVVYWLAETYARYLAERTVAPREAAHASARHHAKHHWRMVTAPFTPLAALALASVLGASTRSAVLAALIVTTGLLAILGWAAGRRAQLSHLQTLTTAGVSSLAGLAMIGLKLALH